MSKVSKTLVWLTDEQLVLLDGQCNKDTQVEVDKAKERLVLILNLAVTDFLKDLSADQMAGLVRIAQSAIQNNTIRLRYTQAPSCDVCGKKAGYAKYTRTTRYHRKGDSNTNRPLSFPVVKLGTACGTICLPCLDALKMSLLYLLDRYPVEVPAELSGKPPKWKSYRKVTCLECGWEGHEGLMIYLPALMGGEYPGQCPDCKSKSLPFGPKIFERPGGRIAVEAPISE